MGTSLLRTFLFIAVAASTAIAVEPGPNRRDAWVLLGSHDNQMSGSMGDLDRARAAAGGAPALFLRRDGHEWLIRDAQLLVRARALLAPLDELGRQQGALGGKQGALGAKQGALGRTMGALSGDPERNQRQMEALGRQMEALGGEMEALGKKQEALGARMETEAHALDGKMAALLAEARAANLAQPLE
ncbi:MAG: Antirepressor regulating drug resistance protein [bacterium]|nr:Antirepressor regulating drug resistance protein [bacterium]